MGWPLEIWEALRLACSVEGASRTQKQEKMSTVATGGRWEMVKLRHQRPTRESMRKLVCEHPKSTVIKAPSVRTGGRRRFRIGKVSVEVNLSTRGSASHPQSARKEGPAVLCFSRRHSKRSKQTSKAVSRLCNHNAITVVTISRSSKLVATRQR